MSKREEIRNIVSELLRLAEARKTAQGVLVYKHTLDELLRAADDPSVDKILEKLNRALAGIEAHGYFTDAEFAQVKRLREIETWEKGKKERGKRGRYP